VSPSWHAPALFVLIVTWLTAPPTSLADVARRETMRRALVGPSVGSFSNLDLPDRPPPAAVSGIPQVERTSPPPAETVTPEAAAESPRDEAWWRNRMAAARTALERDQVLRDAMQTRINSLQSDVVNIDDPAQQALARQNLGRALGELERLEKQVQADQEEIKRVQDEARRERVPPGWIR
jgi:hypothetical protein